MSIFEEEKKIYTYFEPSFMLKGPWWAKDGMFIRYSDNFGECSQQSYATLLDLNKSIQGMHTFKSLDDLLGLCLVESFVVQIDGCPTS